MVFVTGDCHGVYNKFSTDAFPEQKEMTRDDIIIVCGDFGLWHKDNEEKWWHKWLASKSFTVVFVDGNHENFDRLYGNEFPVVDFHGGKAHKVSENIYHLMRGYVFDFEGKKYFAFGGAASHDIDDGIVDREDYTTQKEFLAAIKKKEKYCEMFRVNHVSWWKEELPSKEEMNFGLMTLAKNNYKVDYIISHCAPQNVVSVFSGGAYTCDPLTAYFNEINGKVKFKKWFFGHYHDNRQIMNDYIMLYEQIIRIS